LRKILKQLVSSSSYQVGALFASLTLFGLVFVSYWLVIASDNTLLRESEEAIRAEIRAFRAAEVLAGTKGVETLLAERITEPRGYFYGLLSAEGELLAGNIPRWPNEIEPLILGTFLFEIEHDLLPQRRQSSRLNSEHFDVMAQLYRLSNGTELLVGRDVDDLEIAQWVAEAFGWAMITILLAICALSFGVAYYVTTRFNRIADTTTRIIETGNLTERLIVDGQWDDLSKLSSLLNRMLEELELRVEGIQSVSNSIAHDLRTPLSRFRASIETQLNGEAKAALLEELDNILRIFNSLLRIARIEAGKEPIIRNEVCLDDLLSDALELYEPVAADRGISMVVTAPTKGLTCHADTDLLFQAIANILDNAVKFSPNQSTIKVTMKEDSAAVEIVLEDEGPGIPAELHSIALERFGRLDASRSTPGSGLGLPLAAAIVRRHGGGLLLGSKKDGRAGLTVTIRLPVS
jgi:signal transduction histidine kinase